MTGLLNVSASPHVRDKKTTTSIMLDVIIALLPATIVGIINFKLDALIIILLCIATCVFTEGIFQKIAKRKYTMTDLSAVVTGLLLALNLPSTVPFYIPILGSVFAILVVKQFFGGIGQNFMNPALAARCFLVISFTGKMTDFTYDAVSGPTPLALLKSGESVDILDMFLGTTAGTIGETSALALLIGGIYLLIRGTISYRIPFFYIATVAVYAAIYSVTSLGGFSLEYIAGHLFGGGLMIGAIFMATDYVTSPVTPKGQIVFGIFLGLLTATFRIFGGSAEGVSYAIILGNLLVPMIEKFTMPKPFGPSKKEKAQKETKEKNEVIPNTIKLFLITLVSGALLGLVYVVTEKPISEQNKKKQQEAYKSVFEVAESFEELAGFEKEEAGKILETGGFKGSDISGVVIAKDSNGEMLGYVVTAVSHEGYGGDIEFSVGITKDGTVNGIEFLSIGETAGLGMNATKDEFKSQFTGKQVSAFVSTKNGAKAENEIDALTGATITTNAVTGTVNAAIYYCDYLEGGTGNE